ncbi:hypothetical protein F4677DRAFT_465848 [Hypoxylon crocopeplum]|nr:hypothetical protein F4677DRAFT_465848 [Hypoxylon crocopeplum]
MTLSYDVPPFRVEGGNISFSEWVSLITLCLSPLLAHLVAGAPEPTILSQDRPKWHDYVCHYNPTSIIWRYATITDRRIRARVWDEGMLATSNAIFWTNRGWDGSEDMVTRALPYCVRLPQRTRLKLLSWETVKTLIVTLQAAQVLATALSNLRGPNDLTLGLGIDTAFVPLSLTDEYTFAMNQSAPMEKYPPDASRVSLDSLLECRDTGDQGPSTIRPISTWNSRLFLGSYVLILQFGLVVLIIYSLPRPQTVTALLFYALYLLNFVVSIPLFICYFIRGFNTSTIIPCISSPWYKAYSMFLTALMVTLVIVAGIQTRKTPCGKFTSWPAGTGDRFLCESNGSLLIHIGNEPDRLMFGLASRFPSKTIGTILGKDEFWVDNFTGSCMGYWSDSSRRHASTIDVLEVEGGKPDFGGNDTLWQNFKGAEFQGSTQEGN